MADDAARFRDHAANERTLLAWIRTGIALMGFGFAIARFGLFLREIAQAGALAARAPSGLGSAWFGVVLVILGFVTNAAATVRYFRVRRDLEAHRDVAPGATLAIVVGVGAMLVALAMAVILSRALAS